MSLTCQTQIALANDYQSLLPEKCLSDKLECHCFTQPALKKIADEIKKSKLCEIELKQLREFTEIHKADAIKIPWYKENSVIIGGMIVSFSVGAIFVYMASK